MPRCTEVTTSYLKEGLDITKGEGKKQWDTLLKSLYDQSGVTGIWWGAVVENPRNIQVIIEWTSKEDFDAFIASPDFAPLMEKVGAITRAPDFFFRVPFRENVENVVTAPVIEFVYQYLNEENAASFRAKRDEFEAVVSKGDGQLKLMSAQALEPVEFDPSKEGMIVPMKSSGKGYMYIAMIGWESIEKHDQWATTDDFRGCIHLLVDNVQGMEIYHASLQKWTPETI